ncbi:MAG: D-alanyl-D-alanine carboxypeptidase [Treponema sp.]|jgi:D-alanyl-D-alanine carboxypeptidase (penicillin-binding protein 5/6)|nr:D-alanyl-D-alanine carboxypeptidase [Treponema sp.]
MYKIISLFCFIFCSPFFAFAQFFSTPPALVPYLQTAPEVISRSAVLIDARTGALLYSKNPDAEICPASLTKLMTMHLAMRAIKEGKASFDELIPITVESWAQSQPPHSSLMFLAPGQIVSLREILLGLAVASGNDAAVAAALRLAPSMEEFAKLMTAEARSMGLSVTRFAESSGISQENITTAREFAAFCRRYLILYPTSLEDFHSVPVLSYPMAANVQEGGRNAPGTITQDNRNVLLKSFPGVDGLKTGFIEESGYNIALTAQREQTRFLLVILGAPSQRGGAYIRDTDGANLLSWAFDNFKTVYPQIGKIENARLWKGREDTAEFVIFGSPEFTAPVSRASSLYFETSIPKRLIAPIPAGAPVGELVISDEYGELRRLPLYAAKNYEKGNIFKRIWHSICLIFSRKT